MRNTKIFLLLAIAACQASADISADIERRGRRVEIDGFLLEWNQRDAVGWGGSSWKWDAINTAEGAAGYFVSQNAQACTSWAFTVSAGGKTFEIKVPEQAAGDFFAFDKGSFENEGIHIIEWLVPRDAVEKGNAITVDAASNCGDTLETLRLTAAKETPASGRGNNYIIAAGVLAAFIAAAYKYARKKPMRKA